LLLPLGVKMLFLLLFFQVVFSTKVERYNHASTGLPSYGLGFFAGGYSPSQGFLNVVEIFNVENNSWYLANISTHRSNIAATSLDNYGIVFFAGGDTKYTYFDTIDIYNVETTAWSAEKLSSPRTKLAATSIEKEGIVFFAGGKNFNGCHSTIDIYNYVTKKWSMYQLSEPRFALSAVALQKLEIVFFAGGFNSFCNQTFIIKDYTNNIHTYCGGPSNTVDIYFNKLNKWVIGNLTVARYDMAATTLENRGLVFFAGGCSSVFEKYSDVIDIFDAIKGNWRLQYLTNPKGFLFAVSLVNKDMVFFGGGISKKEDDVIDIYHGRGIWMMHKLEMARSHLQAVSFPEECILVIAGGKIGNNATEQYEIFRFRDANSLE